MHTDFDNSHTQGELKEKPWEKCEALQEKPYDASKTSRGAS